MTANADIAHGDGERRHLPECPVPAMEARHGPLHPEDAEANCICTELRACEERVREQGYGAQSEAWGQGFLYALDAARQAVAVTVNDPNDPAFVRTEYQCCGTSAPEYMRDDALAAIDVLRTGSGLADHPSGDGSARTA